MHSRIADAGNPGSSLAFSGSLLGAASYSQQRTSQLIRTRGRWSSWFSGVEANTVPHALGGRFQGLRRCSKISLGSEQVDVSQVGGEPGERGLRVQRRAPPADTP